MAYGLLEGGLLRSTTASTIVLLISSIVSCQPLVLLSRMPCNSFKVFRACTVSPVISVIRFFEMSAPIFVAPKLPVVA